MAPWILVLQLLLMPFVWASPASNLADDSQLSAHCADTEVTATITREKEGQRISITTPSLSKLLVLWVIPQSENLTVDIVSSSPPTFLTYASIIYLHLDLSTPPPSLV